MKMLQEPGFLWDLYYVFYLNFNSEEFLKTNNESEYLSQHCKDILSQFGDISNELFVFFHVVWKHKSTFIHSCYLKEFEKNYKENYNVDTLQREVLDYNQVIKNMIGFYFYDLSADEVKDCLNSKETLFACVKNSRYSTEEKIKLYEFFINPIYYINLFQRTIIDKLSILYVYYKEYYKKIIDAYDYSLIQQIDDSPQANVNDSNDREKYVSFCLLDREHFELIGCNNDFLYLLGVDYKHNKLAPEATGEDTVLRNFCYALSEKSRINILLYLLEKREVTCKDLEREFSFSGSTAYHHLSIMTRNGIVRTHNKGKTVFYSMNKDMFDEVYTFLRKFI